MKKLILLILIAPVLFTYSYAQKGKVATAKTLLTSGDVDKAKANIEEALNNEYTMKWARTYLVGAEAYSAGYLVSKDPQDLLKANDYIKKALMYDKVGDIKGKGKGKFANQIKLFISSNLKPTLSNGGIEAFNAEDYAISASLFSAAIESGSADVFSESERVIDSGLIFNTGIAAARAENHEMAAEYFKRSAEIGYEGESSYALLSQQYLALGDTTQMIATLKEGAEAYPNEKSGILLSLINLYLTEDLTDEAFNYIDKALASDPTNTSLLFAKGVIYERKEDFPKAIETYEKVLAIDPNHSDALYNLGVQNYNIGTKIFNEAINLTDNAKYEAEIAKAKIYFEKALPYFERAHLQAPENMEIANSLKQAYFRLEDEEGVKKMDEVISKNK